MGIFNLYGWLSGPLQLVQEKYQEEKTCEKRYSHRIIIIIIIIIRRRRRRRRRRRKTIQGDMVTILWNQQIETDRTISNNKPDIIIRDKEKGTCMLIDVAIS